MAYKPKTCTVCGVLFTPRNGSQRRCSEDCAREHNRLYWNKWHHDNLDKRKQQYRAAYYAMLQRDPERVQRNQAHARAKRAENNYASEIERRRLAAEKNPEKYARHLERRNEWQKSYLRDNPEAAEMQRRANKRSYAKRSTNPEFRAAAIEKRRQYMDKLRADPERYEAHLEKARNARRRRALEKLIRNINDGE